MIVVRQCQPLSSYHYRHYHHRRCSPSRDDCGIAAISSTFPLTYVRLSSIASSPTLARSTHHLRHHPLITFFVRPTYETLHVGEPRRPEKIRSAPFIAPYTTLEGSSTPPSQCRSRGKILGVSSPELSRGDDPLVDSAEPRTSPTVCEKARARFPRYPPRVSASCCPLRPACRRAERGETRDTLCVHSPRDAEDP